MRSERWGPGWNAGDGHYTVSDGRRRWRHARRCVARSARSLARRRLGQFWRERLPGSESCAVRQHAVRLQQTHLHLGLRSSQTIIGSPLLAVCEKLLVHKAFVTGPGTWRPVLVHVLAGFSEG